MPTHPSPDYAAPAPSMCCTAQLQAILGRESSVCIRLGAMLTPKSWAELHKLTQVSSPFYCDHPAHQAVLERCDLFAQCCANSLYSEWNLWFLEWVKPRGFWTRVDMQMVRHSGRSDCTPDCRVSPKHLFFFILSVMETAKILIDTPYKVWRKRSNRNYSLVFSALVLTGTGPDS